MLKKVEAFTTLPATDLDRAQAFYESLGLKTKRVEDKVITMEIEGGPSNIIYERETPTKAEHTVLTFEISHLENEIKELVAKGVVFEDYDLPDLKTVNHICEMDSEKAAWFKDSEGNILCLHEALEDEGID